jgi:ATP-dependent DNA ligase
MRAFSHQALGVWSYELKWDGFRVMVSRPKTASRFAADAAGT